MKRALARDDLFIVGSDAVMTDSMRYADVILPSCTNFEHADLYPAYGHHYLQRAEAVIPPVGESLPLTEIFRRLAAKFGFDDPMFKASDEELMDSVANADDARMQGIVPSRLPVGSAIPMYQDSEAPLLFVNTRPQTRSGKIELLSEKLAKKFIQPLPSFRPVESDYPLTLITPASDQRITSTFGNVEACNYTPPLAMHPDDAAARGLSDGQQVRVWNELGEVHLPLQITATIRPGVVSSDKGAWFKTSDNGQTVSALAPLHKADLDGACFNDARVEVAGLAAD
jgi:anaerobic selenocysteine-containing dehydrogenase